MSYVFKTLIVDAQDVVLAREIAATLGKAGGEGMWLTGLSSDGQEPATHYVSTGYVSSELAALVPTAFYEQNEEGQWVQTDYIPGNASMVVAACVAADPPLEVTVEQVEAIYSRSDVTEQDPYIAFNRLGIQMVQTPLN